MKNLLLSFTLFLYTGFASAQVAIDTVYLDSKFEKTSKKDCAYYKVITKDSLGLFDQKIYFSSGEVKMTGKFSSLDPEVRQGRYVYYRKNGALSQIVNFKDNAIIGKVKNFYPDGRFDIEYIGNPDSLDNAAVIRDKIAELLKFTSKNLKYPERSQDAGVEGKVIIEFFVGENGKVFRTVVLKSVNEELDLEARRIIGAFGLWPSPMYRGRKTVLGLSFPITFTLY